MGRRRKTQNQSFKTTADYLARAVFDDLLPEHPQTCKDYGFDRAITIGEKCYLLGLYSGLIKFLEVSPETIHGWRVRGVLVDEIKAAFYKIPERSRGAYFPWFLRNQHIVALAGKPLSANDIHDRDDAMLTHTRGITGGSEEGSPRAATEHKSASVSVVRKSVWDLEQFALRESSADEETPMLPIMVDYGFINCENVSEIMELKKVYMDFFTTHRGNPLALHEACVNGILYTFLSNIMQGLRGPKYRRLLKNPYPLQGHDVDETCHTPDPLLDPGVPSKLFSDGIYSGKVQTYPPPLAPAHEVSSVVLLVSGAMLAVVLASFWM